MKILYVTSLSGKRINGFMRSSILAAKELGYEFTLVSNMDMADKEGYAKDCEEYGIIAKHVDFERIPWKKKNLKAKKQLLEIMEKENFDIVHCNTAIGGVLGRICAHKVKIPCVIYQAHGFHFCKGSPIKNWLFYYPVEWLLAHWTDILITINEEDFSFAQKHMIAKEIRYVPGVGIDLQRFGSNRMSHEERNIIRESLGVSERDKLLLSVGELIERKNHKSVIRALAKMRDEHVKYFICGSGKLLKSLQKLIDKLQLSDNIRLLGFRTDIPELCKCADLFILPSFQEGLPIALMEAIASKTSVICSNIRGNIDLVVDEAVFKCNDINGIAEKIKQYLYTDRTTEINANYEILKKFDISVVISDMANIYQCVSGETVRKPEMM